MIRKDKYQVGDKVTWDQNVNDRVPRFREEYGEGPFEVKKVSDVDPRSYRLVSHTQHLTFDMEKSNTTEVLSGAWFNPVRNEDGTLIQTP